MSQFLANGVCNGAIYAMVALGFGLIFFATKTFHIAHGGIFTSGAYACYVCLVPLGLPLIVSILAGIIFGGLLGVLMEVVVYFPLVDPRKLRDPSSTVLTITSLGAYSVAVNLLSLVFGEETKVLRSGAERAIHLAGTNLTVIQIWQCLACIIAILATALILKTTRFGKTVRALTDDSDLVNILGNNVRVLRAGLFALGSILAAAGGVFAALDIGVDPHIGFQAMLIGAVAAIVGGVGNFLAPILGAFLIGVLQSLVVWQTSGKWSNAVVFGLLIVVLLVRPQGILAPKRRLEEM